MSPVTVKKISPYLAAFFIGITSKPSKTASIALIGSTSVTITWAPNPLARIETPFPHHPYPATTTVFPVTVKLVLRITPSHTDCPVPYLLSNKYLQ